MIKASDINTWRVRLDASRLLDIEKHIDQSITYHCQAGLPWPLTVKITRSGWRTEEVEAVLVRYRAAGWTALDGGTKAMCVLAPDRGGVANRIDEGFAAALAAGSDAQPDDQDRAGAVFDVETHQISNRIECRGSSSGPLLGFSPDEIIVGPGGQTLEQAALIETAESALIETAEGDLIKVSASIGTTEFASAYPAGSTDARLRAAARHAVITALINASRPATRG